MPAPKIFQIFRPRKGKPLSLRGMAAMLSSTAKAWHTLDVLGGYVDWSHGRPTIVPNGSSGGFGGQLDHSFLPTQKTANTFDITKGVVYMGEEDAEVLPVTFEGISFATNTHFQIKIDISSVAPVATWEAGTSFTANTDTALYYPILEFGTAGDFSSLIRHQTSDIHISTVPTSTTPAAPAATAAVGTEAKYARGNHAHAAPMLHLIKPATANTELVPTTDDSRDIQIGTWDIISETGKRWAGVEVSASEQISMGVGGADQTSVLLNLNDVLIETQKSIELRPKGSAFGGYLEMYNIPSSSVGANRVWRDSDGFLKLG